MIFKVTWSGIFQPCLWPLKAPDYLGEGCRASCQPSDASTPPRSYQNKQNMSINSLTTAIKQVAMCWFNLWGVTILSKVFVQNTVPLSRSSIIWYRYGQTTVILCGWGSNSGPGGKVVVSYTAAFMASVTGRLTDYTWPGSAPDPYARINQSINQSAYQSIE